jgi:MFS family permease
MVSRRNGLQVYFLFPIIIVLLCRPECCCPNHFSMAFAVSQQPEGAAAAVTAVSRHHRGPLAFDAMVVCGAREKKLTGCLGRSRASVVHRVSRRGGRGGGGGGNVLRQSLSERAGDDLMHRHGKKNKQEQDTESRRLRLVSLALASSYFAVMGAKCALPSVLPLLLSPTIGLSFPSWTTSPQALFAQLLTISTLSVAIGKLLLGPVIDHFGGTASMQAALIVLFLLLGTISVTTSFWIFTTCWILIDFCFSSCWPACINAIHQNFAPNSWGAQVGRLAAAARAGNSVAFAAFASILHYAQTSRVRQYWRPVFGAASLVQLIPLVLLHLTTKLPNRDAAAIPTKDLGRPTFGQSVLTLRREFRRRNFWLHLASRSALMIVASFLLFVPTLVTSVFGLSAAAGARAGSLYALGCLLSVSALSNVYSSSGRRKRIMILAALLGLGATGSSLALLGHVSSWWAVSPSMALFLLFVWGFSFAIPFYVSPTLYALSRGGKLCSATITDSFDVIGFGLLALFNGYLAGLEHSIVSSWILTFALTTGCSVVSLVALIAATARETAEDPLGKDATIRPKIDAS